MKARSIVVLLVLTGALVAKEWSIKIFPPPPAQFTIYQMWSCQITNPEKEAQKVKLHGFIERNGKKIGDATSKPIEMRPGGNRITYRDLKGYEKVWWDKKYEDLAKKGRPLPAGTYYYCIEVIDPKTREVLAKDCNEVKKKVTHRLRLISPKNGAMLKEGEFPTFIWTPITPPVKGVTYTLRIAEVPKGMPESISDEILMRCPPVHKEKGITRTTFKYPSSARKLKKGKKYAWQVIAVSEEGIEIAKSGIRTVKGGPVCFCDWCATSTYTEHIGSDASTLIDDNGNGECDPADPSASVIPWLLDKWEDCEVGWGAMHDAPRSAEWIWRNTTGTITSQGQCVTFLRCFDVPTNLQVVDACLELSADDKAKVWLNGNLIGEHPATPEAEATWHKLSCWDVDEGFFEDHNKLRIEVCDVHGVKAGLLYCLHYKTEQSPCQCGKWGSLNVSWDNESQSMLPCGQETVFVDPGTEVTVSGEYVCNPDNPDICPDKYQWHVWDESGNYITTNPPCPSLPSAPCEFSFTSGATGCYKTTIMAYCDEIKCGGCDFWVCSTECPCPDSLIYNVCTEGDGFLGPECPNPSSELIDWINANYNPDNDYYSPPNPLGCNRLKCCDTSTINRYWAHTFHFPVSAPPRCEIESARLEIRVHNGDSNDNLKLGFISDGASSWQWTQTLAALGVPVGSDGWIGVDLSSLPGFIALMQTHELLDIAIQDDSNVDCAKLIIFYQ